MILPKDGRQTPTDSSSGQVGKTISHYPALRPARLAQANGKAGGDRARRDKILEKLGEARPPERRSRAGPNQPDFGLAGDLTEYHS